MRKLSAAAGVISACLLWYSVAPARADDGAAPESRWHEDVLELRLNGVVSGDFVIALRDEGGGLWLVEQDFVRLRLRLPHAPPHIVHGQRYFPLTAIPGTQVRYDDARGQASISAPAAAFDSSSLSLASGPRPAMSRSGVGVFANYSLYGQTGHYTGANVASGYGELGFFSPLGVLTSTGAASDAAGTRSFVRLETTMSHDFPDSLQTLRLGDVISAAGSWASAVRFGGLQWGTNYAIRPDLVTTPLLAASGTAVVPSTVDVFVNGKQVGTTNVPAGPFVVNQVPALTGSGDVRIVVRDVLGREQVMTVPFYSSAVLLQPGLSLYDIDVGAVRNNFGLVSDDYGPMLLSGTWRRGLTSRLTAELHAEDLRGGPHAAGLDFARAIDHWLVVTADLAAGGEAGSSGSYGALGLERVDPGLSFTLRIERSSNGFRDVGDESVALPRPRDRRLVQLGRTLGRVGNFAVAFVEQRNFDDTRQRSFGLSWSTRVGAGSVSANATRTTGLTPANSVYLFYTLPLSSSRTASTAARHDSQQPTASTALVETLQKSVPLGEGDGYLLAAGTDGSFNADWIHQAAALTMEAGAARLAGQSAERLSLSGGATWLEGELRASRSVRDSFAVVDIGVPHMTVYFDNQPVARTDGSGLALVRDLRSYEVNRLSIDPAQLPLDASLSGSRVEIVPPYRSGTVVRFPVKREHSGVFRLRREDGRPVPAGAEVRFQGHSLPVGLDGMTYVTDYDRSTSGEAHWDGVRCKFSLPAPPPDEPQPDLGQIVCHSSH